MKPSGVQATVDPSPAVRPLAVSGAARDFWSIVASHAVVDVFPMVIISLMIVLEQRLGLTQRQETIVWIATPIFSGLFQPLFAWLGDRFDTRLAAPVGLALGAVCIGSIGLARSFEQLLALQIAGVIGIGMYHPAAAATAGQVGARALRGRAFALSIFVAAGMVGHTVGPLVATRINAWFGIGKLVWLIPPSLLAAALLHRSMRHVAHRPHDHRDRHAALSAAEGRTRWVAAVLLSAQNAVRFMVNMAMYITFNYWAAWHIAGEDRAANLAGNLTAAITIGMGLGALLAGRFFRQGGEKVAFSLSAFGGAACIACLPWLASSSSPWPIYLGATFAAVGFFATIPPSVGLGQRLLPSHASLATALLLGVGWMAGALARPATSWLLGGAKLDEAHLLDAGDFTRAWLGFAALLSVAGVLAIAMPGRALSDVAEHD